MDIERKHVSFAHGRAEEVAAMASHEAHPAFVSSLDVLSGISRPYTARIKAPRRGPTSKFTVKVGWNARTDDILSFQVLGSQ
jgi:hypothetical protein